MRITNHDIPGLPGYEVDYTNASAPWLWVGQRAVDGTAAPWSVAPVGSVYLKVLSGAATLYVKTADANADADWRGLVITGDTITGDVTISGTLTAGELVTAE